MARVSRATAEPQPLKGRTIVVTRARAQAQRFVQLLEAAGARVLRAPTIVIEPPASWEPLDTALAALDSFTWLIFTSVNGVAMVDRRLVARGTPWAAIARKRVAAIGPATADALAEHGVRVEAVPAEYRAEGLVERLRAVVGPADRVLLPRAKDTRDILVVELRRLVPLHDLRARRGERQLVRGEVLDEGEPEDDHEHQPDPGVQDVEEDEGERDVEEAEQAAREEQPQRQPCVATVSLAFHRWISAP